MQIFKIIYLLLWAILVLLVFYFGVRWIFPGFYRGIRGGLLSGWKGLEEETMEEGPSSLGGDGKKGGLGVIV